MNYYDHEGIPLQPMSTQCPTCKEWYGSVHICTHQLYSSRTPIVSQLDIAIAKLVAELVEAKGWTNSYADSIIRDAIDRSTFNALMQEISRLQDKVADQDEFLLNLTASVDELRANMNKDNLK